MFLGVRLSPSSVCATCSPNLMIQMTKLSNISTVLPIARYHMSVDSSPPKQKTNLQSMFLCSVADTTASHYLIQCLAIDLNTVDLQHLIINCKKPCTFCQATRHQTWNKDTRHFLQSSRGNSDRCTISDVKSQRLIWTMFQQSHSPACLRHNIDINYCWHLSRKIIYCT